MKNTKAQQQQSPQKILLVQLFSNGDCLYATTVARQIKADFPGCHLTWAIANYCRSIIENNPYVDDVLEVKEINYKNWKSHWNSFRNKMKALEQGGQFDKIVFSQLVASNYANYDYSIRSSILRAYGRPITVPVQPVLQIAPAEIQRAEDFNRLYQLEKFKHRILFEFAPRSGQGNLTAEAAVDLAKSFAKNPTVTVILSSNIKIDNTSTQIIDGSQLSLRETAHLSKSCTLLIGSSSGITWATTSSAGKELPMVQLLNSNSYWLNSVVDDHKRFGLQTDHIIELDNPSTTTVEECVMMILGKDFQQARSKYHVDMPRKFMMTRGIIIYLLGTGNIKGLLKHIRINIGLFGWHPRLLRNILLGFITFPVFYVIEKFKRKERA